MKLSVEHHDVIFGDGFGLHRSIQVPDAVLIDFLEKFFKKMFQVAGNRSCHRCGDSCRYGITLHLGRPFSKRFSECVPV